MTFHSNDFIPLRNHLPIPPHDALLVVPLGGTSRVGMNATLVGHAGRWILVDVGATFAGADDTRSHDLAERHGGVLEQIIPDFRAIAANMGRIDGIVLTHAHEDHVGGIRPLFAFSDLWPRLTQIPIHATPYTLASVRKKLEETGAKPKLRQMQFRKPTRIGPFEIIPINVTHSAPETAALAIRTKAGTIVLGSDMKLDPNPVLGSVTDTRALEFLGHSGVLAFLGDSTNAANAGRSASEGDVRQGLAQIMSEHPGRVVVSTFASNVARLLSVAQAAHRSRRSLAMTGRSILQNVETAKQVGALDRLDFYEPRDVARFSSSKVAMVCTGSQAEPSSALRRMADDFEVGRRGRGLSLDPGDLVIHSARVIPGNEQTVKAMFDTFRANGVHVLEAGGDGLLIHASGHARRDELADFYRMLRPRFAVPVHGTRELISAHTDLAMSSGVEGVLSPAEGEVLRIAEDGVSIVGRLRLGQLATIAVGGRNAGETKLVGWENAKSPDMVNRTEVRGYRPRQRDDRRGFKDRFVPDLTPAPAFA